MGFAFYWVTTRGGPWRRVGRQLVAKGPRLLESRTYHSGPPHAPAVKSGLPTYGAVITPPSRVGRDPTPCPLRGGALRGGPGRASFESSCARQSGRPGLASIQVRASALRSRREPLLPL